MRSYKGGSFLGFYCFSFAFHCSKKTLTNFFLDSALSYRLRRERGEWRSELTDKLMDCLRVDTNAQSWERHIDIDTLHSPIFSLFFLVFNMKKNVAAVGKITENFTYKRRQHFLIVFSFFWVKSKATKAAHPRAKPR